jgi:hypothetical protein
MEIEPEEYDRGVQDGKGAVARGTPRLYYGARGLWGTLLVRLMEERFGVTVEVTSCLTDEQRQAYRRGYNKITVDFIDATFGAGSFHSLLDEVNRFRQKSYRNAFTSTNDEST